LVRSGRIGTLRPAQNRHTLPGVILDINSVRRTPDDVTSEGSARADSGAAPERLVEPCHWTGVSMRPDSWANTG
jgi:hypothetical protein